MRRIVGTLLAYALLAFVMCFGVGCTLFRAASPRVEQFECRVQALQPLVGDVMDAEQLVRDVYAGRASLGAVVGALDATQSEVLALTEALAACNGPVPDAGLPQGVAY